ncbi:MAG: hypothetical protein U0Q16_26800 [Bryobacteraceae bacterium]
MLREAVACCVDPVLEHSAKQLRAAERTVSKQPSFKRRVARLGEFDDRYESTEIIVRDTDELQLLSYGEIDQFLAFRCPGQRMSAKGDGAPSLEVLGHTGGCHHRGEARFERTGMVFLQDSDADVLFAVEFSAEDPACASVQAAMLLGIAEVRIGVEIDVRGVRQLCQEPSRGTGDDISQFIFRLFHKQGTRLSFGPSPGEALVEVTKRVRIDGRWIGGDDGVDDCTCQSASAPVGFAEIQHFARGMSIRNLLEIRFRERPVRTWRREVRSLVGGSQTSPNQFRRLLALYGLEPHRVDFLRKRADGAIPKYLPTRLDATQNNQCPGMGLSDRHEPIDNPVEHNQRFALSWRCSGPCLHQPVLRDERIQLIQRKDCDRAFGQQPRKIPRDSFRRRGTVQPQGLCLFVNLTDSLEEGIGAVVQVEVARLEIQQGTESAKHTDLVPKFVLISLEHELDQIPCGLDHIRDRQLSQACQSERQLVPAVLEEGGEQPFRLPHTVHLALKAPQVAQGDQRPEVTNVGKIREHEIAILPGGFTPDLAEHMGLARAGSTQDGQTDRVPAASHALCSRERVLECAKDILIQCDVGGATFLPDLGQVVNAPEIGIQESIQRNSLVQDAPPTSGEGT